MYRKTGGRVLLSLTSNLEIEGWLGDTAGDALTEEAEQFIRSPTWRN